MSTSIAIAAGAAATAGAANSISQKSLKVSCQDYVKHYQHDTATVQEARQYADCIDVLHPDSVVMSDGHILLLKVMIVFALAGAVFGLFKSGQYSWNSAFGHVMMSGGYCFLFAVIPPVCVGIFYTIKFLFS